MSTAPPAFLANFLKPLAEHLARQDVTDIYVNRPGELWLESMSGGIERILAPELTAHWLDRLARQIAAFSSQGVNREHPVLSASLPDGARVQIIIPPATRGSTVMAIRKHLVMDRCGDVGAGGKTEAEHPALRRHLDWQVDIPERSPS